MEVEINVWGVIAAIVSSFVVGMIWYSPKVFGEMWRKLIKMDKKTMQKGPDSSAWVYTVTGAALQAYVLAYITFLAFKSFEYSFMFAALSTAFMMWLGFQISLLLTHDSFEQRPLKLTMLNAGNQLVTLLVMGLLIGWIGK